MVDTIFAPATARGKAGVAIVRVSGPRALCAAQELGAEELTPRRVSLRKLTYKGDVLDDALTVHFPVGASFTGEDIVEFHVHGSVAVVSSLLQALGSMTGLRFAEPGEFTRRALENGRLDLTQVEGLADLIDAETESQRKQAQRVLSGAIGARASEWRKDLVRAAALIEAAIDFADEDVPSDVAQDVLNLVDLLLGSFRTELEGSKVAERIRDGFEVAIIGAPNVGKSSLLNALAGREAAITSSVAGTTRDVIEVRMDIGGLAVTLLDTAGLRETSDEVEKLGIDRAIRRSKEADLRILLLDPYDEKPVEADDPKTVVVWSKADLAMRSGSISSKTGFGLDVLTVEIRQKLSEMSSSPGILVRERQRQALSAAVIALESARLGLMRDEPELELVAAELRAAGLALEMLVGQIGVESLLDEIFSSFCIGK